MHKEILSHLSVAILIPFILIALVLTGVLGPLGALIFIVVAPFWLIYFIYGVWRSVRDYRVRKGFVSAVPLLKPSTGLLYNVIGFCLLYGFQVVVEDVLNMRLFTCNEGGVGHTVTLGISSCGWAFVFFTAEAVFAIFAFIYLVKLIRHRFFPPRL